MLILASGGTIELTWYLVFMVAALKVGDQVVLQAEGSAAIVCRGQYRIGAVAGIPADVGAALKDCGGIALGTVERVSLFGNNAELRIQ